MWTVPAITATRNHLSQAELPMALRLPRTAEVRSTSGLLHSSVTWCFIFQDVEHLVRKGVVYVNYVEEGSGLVIPVESHYLLYDWQGQCKWAYLEGVFLVDPQFEAEFKSEHGAA